MFVPDFEGDALELDGVDDRTEEDRPLGLGEAAFLRAGRADLLSRLGRCSLLFRVPSARTNRGVFRF